jgi:hypothetical protein
MIAYSCVQMKYILDCSGGRGSGRIGTWRLTPQAPQLPSWPRQQRSSGPPGGASCPHSPGLPMSSYDGAASSVSK